MVEIKPFDLQNVALYYKWNIDEELNDQRPENDQRQSFETFLRHIKSLVDKKNKTAELFEIHLRENHRLIGIVEVSSIDEDDHRCLLQCMIGDREYSRKGYEVEALKPVLAYCFNQRGMHKVQTAALKSDSYWIKEVSRLGFKQERTSGASAIKEDGAHNQLIFSLLAGEYAKRLRKDADPAVTTR